MLYGTTVGGGVGIGTIYSFVPSSKTETVLHDFGTDGYDPESGVIAFNGILYGTAWQGGHDWGSVYSFNPQTNTYQTVHSFEGGADGGSPETGLTKDGTLVYGTTAIGTLYSLNPETGAVTTVYTFNGPNDGSEPLGRLLDVGGVGGTSGGAQPCAGLTDVDGALYGTTLVGGSKNSGTVFSVSLSGSEKVLHNFTGPPRGREPSSLLLYLKGNLYGTTRTGGSVRDDGMIFKLSLSGTETILHRFLGAPDDTQTPYAGMHYFNGRLYGTGSGGGLKSPGAIFELIPPKD